MRHFPRSKLARDTADAMQGKSLFGDAPNGLFLAAPRRTGKSTFLQRDLAPELERRGIAVVYLDLWADQTRDPGSLIAEAIGKVINTELGWVARAAKSTHLESISVGGALRMDTSKIGQHQQRIGQRRAIGLADLRGVHLQGTRDADALEVR